MVRKKMNDKLHFFKVNNNNTLKYFNVKFYLYFVLKFFYLIISLDNKKNYTTK